jgi:excisionase family DNA binding protein
MLLDEIAEDLGISRRRAQALAQSGELRAERFGSMWVVHPDDLAEYKLRRKDGRPVSPAVAWQILLLLSGIESPENDRMVTFRARQHLLGESIIGKLRRSRRTAGRHRWRILTEDLGGVLESGVLTGASAADGEWFDVIAADVVPKVYLAQSRVEEIMRSLSPLVQSSKPNVEVLIPSDDWVLGLGKRAPDAVVAADLLLDPDPRIRRAAEHHLDSLQASWKIDHD